MKYRLIKLYTFYKLCSAFYEKPFTVFEPLIPVKPYFVFKPRIPVVTMYSFRT